jgi:hypothetical protein
VETNRLTSDLRRLPPVLATPCSCSSAAERHARSGKRADHNVVTVWISERELSSPSGPVRPGFLLELLDQGSAAQQRLVEIVHTEKEQQPIARLRTIRSAQGWVLVVSPPMETKQDRAIRVKDLPEVVMGRRRFRLTEKRLIPVEAAGHISDSNDRPRALHDPSLRHNVRAEARAAVAEPSRAGHHRQPAWCGKGESDGAEALVNCAVRAATPSPLRPRKGTAELASQSGNVGIDNVVLAVVTQHLKVVRKLLTRSSCKWLPPPRILHPWPEDRAMHQGLKGQIEPYDAWLETAVLESFKAWWQRYNKIEAFLKQNIGQ